ncbi:probable histone-lysine N-methyltransferase PRDM7 [Trichonephila inaurata madagascariensis]|uniref:Probable histone-lysine N-methyltransferase PRDM7 n=1 Tax=Trichonephila inaurata madagascariensis TaxID=2747483 RepID=A0A8X6Y625_9ARAC|nr:probable histone-lysine N-methyltransferase PRDM7 [Trichonephila inaurata madagascariensis]
MEGNTSSEKEIKQYFTSDAWTALSEYEKRRYENVQRNYEFLKASGITPKIPEFMMTKYNHSNPKNQMKRNSNMSNGDGMKKAKFKLFAVPKQPSKKNKNLDRGASPKDRYPKRNVERKCYAEEDISSEDESLHCDICDEEYKGACPVHGPMLLVRRGLKVSHYVEGRDEGCSNWMRYVNCADREERQNVVAFQYQGDIYYRTYKPVLPFTEILVWYGDGYASDLGIDLQQEKELECRKEIVGFKCDVCENLFSSSRALRAPQSILPRTTWHQCPECSYSTSLATHMRRHMLTHSGEKPHACPRCHKRFSQEENLRQHLVVHTGEKSTCAIPAEKFN